jgi:hypothetical protein
MTTAYDELDKVRAEFAKQTADGGKLQPAEVRRDPVAFRYDAVLPGFMKQLAELGHHASEKYGSWEQYLNARLTGEKSPVNHIYDHLRAYAEGEPYDHFEGDVSRHLVAVAYNALMEWAYVKLYGHDKHPFTKKMEEIAAQRRTETT